MKLWSRLSGRTRARLPDLVVQDLFEARDLPAGKPLRVVPGGMDEATSFPFLGGAPSDLDTSAIERVVEPLRHGAPWSAWVDAIPLAPRIDERARLNRLEIAILAHLPQLQHVCHRPRLHLRVEEDRVPVSRARRIPARAVASLVSHPGDWEQRTLRSVRPARILAVQVEDDWNLYENRVAARLVDQLLAHVGKRLEELRRLDDLVRDADDFTSETRGSIWRARRLSALWAVATFDDALRRELAHTLAVLGRVQGELQALLDSPLYRNVPRGTFVPVGLRHTNILVNDPRYRKVAALWRAWAAWGHVMPPSRAQLGVKRQEDCVRFGLFALLLTVHALNNLGYQAPPGAVLPGADPVELEGPLGRARLHFADGVLRFEVGASALRLVAVLTPVEQGSAAALWREIRDEARSTEDGTVVFLLGRRNDAGQADPATARALAGWEQPRVVLLSPWSLDCTERVARVLRQAEASRRFTDYPSRSAVRSDPDIELPRWLQRSNMAVAVVSPASAAERQAFAGVCDRRQVALEQAEKAARAARGAVDPGRLRALAEIRALAARAAELEPWSVCPVCKCDQGNAFAARTSEADPDRWTFWCSCARCSSEWGLKPCTRCRTSFPVLVSRPRSSPEGTSREAGWIDRAYGRDVWAEPCSKPGAEDSFRCSRCGACPCGGCSRCSVEQDPPA